MKDLTRVMVQFSVNSSKEVFLKQYVAAEYKPECYQEIPVETKFKFKGIFYI